MLTARAENHIRGNPDLDDTIARLQAYERAGADVLYAPGLRSADEIRAVCEATSKPAQRARASASLTMSEIAEAGAGGSASAARWPGSRSARWPTAAEEMRDRGDFSLARGAGRGSRSG